MVQLALHANGFFVADARESYRTDGCYTVDTLTAFLREIILASHEIIAPKRDSIE